MMFKSVMGLAAVMVAAGGAAIFNGWEMVLNERGWSQVIAGSVVLSTALLIIALGGLLAHFKAFLAKTLSAIPVPTVRDERIVVSEPVQAFDLGPIKCAAHPDDQAIQHHDNHHAAEASLHQLDTAVSHEPPAAPAAPGEPKLDFKPEPNFKTEPDFKPEPFDPVYKPSRAPQKRLERNEGEIQEPVRTAHDLLAELTPQPIPMPTVKSDEWAPGSNAGSGLDSQQAPIAPVQPSLLDRLAHEIEHPVASSGQPSFLNSFEPRRPIMPPVPPPAVIERELVASYTAGGVGYFMYSDQTIEAEMAIGRYRFASMDELRHFVETNEGGVKVGESSQI